jgi:di- and tripeptidase
MHTPQAFLQIPAANVVDSAHYGYIYCIALLEGSDADGPHDRIQLVTGSGDETVKVMSIPLCMPNLIYRLMELLDGQLWDCSPVGPSIAFVFDGSQGAVLSLAICAETIYAGCQDGYVKVLDLETKTLVRTIIVQEVSKRLIV